MKKLSTLTWVFVAGFIAMAMVSCAKSGGGGGNQAPTPPVTALTIPPGVQFGFFAQNNKMNSYYNSGGSTYTIQSGMKTILKYAMGVCDRNATDGGLANCNAWMGNAFHDIMIFANGSQANTVKLVLRAMPDTTCTGYTCGWYSFSLPNFSQFFLGLFGFNTFNNAGAYNPMILDMTINPICVNANGINCEDRDSTYSTGFELRGYAPEGATYKMGRNLLFQVQVPVGKLEDQSWDFNLYYNGQTAGSGRMVRCVNANCGVQGF
jgi:hypothetical protein